MHFRSSVRMLATPLNTLLTAVLCIAVQPAVAQGPRDSIPSSAYFATFPDFIDGDYKAALQSFRSEAGSGIRTTQSRWIDSVCYHTMVGECYYQVGQFDQALEQYNAALKLFNAFHDWMMRVQFPANIRSAGPAGRLNVPWGRSSRRSNIGQFPETMMMSQGRVDNSNSLRRGGTVQAPVFFPVHVTEIIRCTTLALRRRNEILGPIAKHEPLSGQLVTSISRRSAPANHWSGAWNDLQLGLAFLSTGETARAVTALERSILVAGEFDHPLTCVALLELGKAALEAGDLGAAATFFEEATYSAANFGDVGVLEEAFRWGSLTHMVSNQKGVYPPLASATAWAKSKTYRQLHASLSLLAAENLAVQGDARGANTMLGEAKTAARTGDMAKSWIGAKFNHLTALLAYQSGKSSAGDQAIAAALDYQTHGSVWLYQINLADKLIASNVSFVTPRIGLMLYSQLLRDPGPADWAQQPLEALSVLAVPHSGAYERWFELALAQGNRELALEISDRVRRHRFYSALPMGGRLLSLRWVLEAPEERLTAEAKLQRQDLLVRYPRYQQLSQEAAQLRVALGPAAADEEGRKAQATELGKLASISEQQEQILREIAVRREPADLAFPPLRNTKEVQASLPPGHILMSFLSTERNLHGFVFSRDRYEVWQVIGKPALKKQVVGLLRDLGNFDQNHELSGADLLKDDWKKSAAKIVDGLFKKSKVDFGKNYAELIIVPDDFLWYLPFEVLPVGKGDTARPLITQTHVRYAPTIGLSMPVPLRPRENPAVGVVLGKLHPQDQEGQSRAAFDLLAESASNAIALTGPSLVPTAIWRTQFDTLVVLDDIEPTDGPFEWSPAQLDRGKPGSQLGAWLALPWGGPRCVILPGFHTHAESSLKKNQGAGNELFLAACGLLGSGTQTVLISRWRTGGQIGFDLVREFVQELPTSPPVDAWQRAVQLAAESTIDSDLEPRVKPLKGETPKGDFPFFWAGYILIDGGVPGEQAAPDEKDPDNEVEAADEDAAVDAPAAAVRGAKPPAAPGPAKEKVEEVQDADEPATK